MSHEVVMTDDEPILSLLRPPGATGGPPDPTMLPDRALPGDPISPDALRDLGLDGVAEAIGARLAPELRDVFTIPLTGVDAVGYRHEVFADLRDPRVLGVARVFEEEAREFDRLRALSPHYPHVGDLMAVHATTYYVDLVDRLRTGLAELVVAGVIRSRAFTALARYAAAYADSSGFVRLRSWSRQVEQALREVRFTVWVRGGRIEVGQVGQEPDLEARVLELFERFREPAGASGTSLVRPREQGMDHVQAAILGLVGRLRPDVFAEVRGLAAAGTQATPDPTLQRAAHELGFYLGYLELLAPLEAAGLPTCLPELSIEIEEREKEKEKGAETETEKELTALDTWDLPLAVSLAAEQRVPVTNDLELRGPERILVISGPNQGGKTTAARTFGQLFHLAAVGCPVPGREVRLMLADRVLTVFERAETADDVGGRLGGELARLHRVLDAVTPHSVVVLNEIYGSTPLQDARRLGGALVERLIALDVPAVLVTFLDELSRFAPQTVSMVSTVDPADPTVRTFRVVRRRADGRAYAALLADRYRLDYAQIVDRIEPPAPRSA